MSLKSQFYRLTKGRPLTLISKTSIFFDYIGNFPVGYYRDKFGVIWMGNMISVWGRWQCGLVRASGTLAAKESGLQ